MSPSCTRSPKPRLLLVGPRIIENDVVGGTQVPFEQLLEALRRRAKIELTVVSTARPLANRGRVGKAVLDTTALLKTLARVWSRAPSVDLVVWYVSPRAALLSGGLVWLACTLRDRSLCVRIFGGNFDEELERASWTCRFLATRTLLKANLLLFETRRLAAKLGAGFRAAWLPMTRDMPRRRCAYRSSCRRLLFLSLLQPEKGLPELVAAAPRFPTGVRLSVFGPEYGFDPAVIGRLPNAQYGGIVPPERVPEVMEAHDALVLPTRYAGEGYSGVVIEAFQMGLPVIVTRHPSLTELVTEDSNGVLVSPGSVDSLVDAVTRLCSDDALFRRLREGARRSGERYRNDLAAEVIEELCRRASGLAEPTENRAVDAQGPAHVAPAPQATDREHPAGDRRRPGEAPARDRHDAQRHS